MPDVANFPQSIQLQTISRCNRACSGCPYSQGFPSTGELFPLEAFDDLAAELAAHPELKRVGLELQNEPLLDKRLSAFVANIKERRSDIATVIVSNGSPVTAGVAKKLKDAGLNLIFVSLNAIDEAGYERSFGVKGYADAVAKIETLREAGLPVGVSYLVDRDSLSDAFQFLKEWEAKGAFVRLWLAHDRCGFLGGDSFLQQRSQCPRVYGSCAITSSGDVIPCCNDWSREAVMGNVHEQSLEAIWNGAKYEAFRRRYESDPGSLSPCNSCHENTDLRITYGVLQQAIRAGIGAFECNVTLPSIEAPIACEANLDYVPMIRHGRYRLQSIVDLNDFFDVGDEVPEAVVLAFEMALRYGAVSTTMIDRIHGTGEPIGDEIICQLEEVGLLRAPSQSAQCSLEL